MIRISFLGFGEAAYCIALGLHQEKQMVEVHAYDVLLKMEDGKCDLLRARAEATGTVLESELSKVIGWADLVIACTPSSCALDVCRESLPFLKETQIYADVSSSTPDVKRQLAGILKTKNIKFADAAMLGSLPQSRHRVPIIASGTGAKDFCDIVNTIGMKASASGREAGDASAIKLLRSIFMKGIASLMLEMTCAAAAYKVEDEVVASIGKVLDGISFEEHLARILWSTAVHSRRRAFEIKGSVQMCKEGNLPHCVTDGSLLWHTALTSFDKREDYCAHRPNNWREIVSDLGVWLDEIKKNDPDNPLISRN
jgi:3-hydroxyisobutyrate dehydrogenase-like beta-hydroxyacid dehydrogenase